MVVLVLVVVPVSFAFAVVSNVAVAERERGAVRRTKCTNLHAWVVLGSAYMQNGFLRRKSEARRETDECMGRLGARVEGEERRGLGSLAGGTKMDRRTNENENERVSLMVEKYVVVVARKIRPFEPHRSWSTQGKFSWEWSRRELLE